MRGSKSSKRIARILFGCSDAEEDKRISGGKVRCGTTKINRVSLTSVFASTLLEALVLPLKGQSQNDIPHVWFFPPFGLHQKGFPSDLFTSSFCLRYSTKERAEVWTFCMGDLKSPVSHLLQCSVPEVSLLALSPSQPLRLRITARNPRTGLSHINATRRGGQMFTGENRS